MKMQIIFGWLPVEVEYQLSILSDYASLLDESFGDCITVLETLEKEGNEYFRTYNPIFVTHLTTEDVLENVLIWDGKALKKFKDFPKLVKYLPHVAPNELLSAEDFSTKWKST